MKVYKIYYIHNDEKVYLTNRVGTEVYITLKGAKYAINRLRKLSKYYNGKEHTTDYFIEEYKCELSGVYKI